jgi:S-(hydroxymethyl)glutathione dehydrogenase / alcohol dehydrogenase
MGAYFGYSDTAGGYPGGQAQYLCVPYANFTPFKIPEDSEVDDEKLVLLADACSTAFWTADNAGIKKGDTVVVIGCGPVGLLSQKFAWLKGAKRVIAVDFVDYRLKHAKRTNNVEIVSIDQHKNTGEFIKEMTKGGADIVLGCSGMSGKMTPLEYVASGVKLQSGAMGGLVIASQAVRKGGTVQVTGAYAGRYNGFPMGDFFNRNITIKTGQAPVIHYMPYLYDLISQGKVDPGDVVTHVLPIDEAEKGYEYFDKRTDNCIKVVLKPHA